VVPNTVVALTSISTNAVRTVTSNDSGTYILQAVSAGLYDLSAQGAGFAPFRRRVEVTVGGRVTTNIQLVVTANEQTITVVGEGGAAVNVQTQEVSQVISSQQVAQLE